MSGFMSGMKRDSEGGARPWALILVAMLFVIVVILAIVALNANRAPEPSESSQQTQEPSSAPSSPSETATPEATTPPAEAAPRLLAAVSDSIAWRGVQGACADGGGSAEISTDGGATWTSLSPSDPEPEEIAQLAPGSDGRRGALVSADSACVTAAQSTATAGDDWQVDQGSLDGATYVLSDGSVRIAGRAMSVPCDRPLTALAYGEGALLCGDGLQLVIDDEWVASSLSSVLAVATDGSSLYAAQTGVESCAGVAISRVLTDATGIDGAPLLCITDLTEVDELSIAATADELWVWSGDEVQILPWS